MKRHEKRTDRNEIAHELRSGAMSWQTLRDTGSYHVTIPAENYRGENSTVTLVPKEGSDVVVRSYKNPLEAQAQYVAGKYLHERLQGDERVYAPEMYDMIQTDDMTYVTAEFLPNVESLEGPYTHPWTSPLPADRVRVLQGEGRRVVTDKLKHVMSPLAFRLIANDIGQRNNLANILHDTTSDSPNRYAVIDQPNMLGRRDIPRAHAIVKYLGKGRL